MLIPFCQDIHNGHFLQASIIDKQTSTITRMPGADPISRRYHHVKWHQQVLRKMCGHLPRPCLMERNTRVSEINQFCWSLAANLRFASQAIRLLTNKHPQTQGYPLLISFREDILTSHFFQTSGSHHKQFDYRQTSILKNEDTRC